MPQLISKIALLKQQSNILHLFADINSDDLLDDVKISIKLVIEAICYFIPAGEKVLLDSTVAANCRKYDLSKSNQNTLRPTNLIFIVVPTFKYTYIH